MTDSSCVEEKEPFSQLKLASFLPLEELKGRSKCTSCRASRKYFCYTCCKPVEALEGNLPSVEVPVQIDVIKHPLEVDGKSTAVHAAILAPEGVKLYTYPCIPDYRDPSKVLLVYPSQNANTLGELLGKDILERKRLKSSSDEPPVSKKMKRDSGPSIPFERVIFIDSTWNQSRQIFNDERLKDLPCVVLADQKTYFWRTQDKDDNYLATIEAVYYFLIELFGLTSDLEYTGQYDDLMYFFVYMYKMVQRQKNNYTKVQKKVKKKKKVATTS